MLQQVDPDELDRVVGGWLAERPAAVAADQPGAIAVDGRTLRGARQPDGQQVKLFAAVVHGHGTVIAQREVPYTTNEVPQFQPLVTRSTWQAEL